MHIFKLPPLYIDFKKKSEVPVVRFNSRRKSVFAEAYNPEDDDEEENKKVGHFHFSLPRFQFINVLVIV